MRIIIVSIFTKLLGLLTKILDGKHLLTNSFHIYLHGAYYMPDTKAWDMLVEKNKQQSLLSRCLCGNEIYLSFYCSGMVVC